MRAGEIARADIRSLRLHGHVVYFVVFIFLSEPE
jgi:hypothetical protein